MNNEMTINRNADLEPNDTIKSRITEARATLKETLAKYAELAKELKAAQKQRVAAGQKFDKKSNSKNEYAYEEAENVYNKAYSSVTATLVVLAKITEEIDKDWSKLIAQVAIINAKLEPKEQAEYDKYKKAYDADKAKIDKVAAEGKYDFTAPLPVAEEEEEPVEVERVEPIPAEPEVEEPVAEEEEEPVAEKEDETVYAAPAAAPAPQVVPQYIPQYVPQYIYPQYMPMPQYMPQYQAPVEAPKSNIAPISIDISAHVEKVVGQAMDKLAESLEKRIAEFFETYIPNVPEGFGANGAVATASSETADLQNKIADDEKFILDKLVAVVEVLKKLNTDMATVTSSYADMDAKAQEVVELQKQTNDMMRHTLREQQGIQVNQRVVNTDQLALTEGQVSINDAQKAALEDHKRISIAQEAIADSQRAIIDTQNSIEEAMKAVMEEQKQIIASQQEIVMENAKQVDSGVDLAQKQAIVADAQREILNAQKQIIREQKNAGERQAETNELQKALLEETREMLKNQKAMTKKRKPAAPKAEVAPVEEAPVVEEAPAVEEAPVVAEAPVVEEAPVAEVATEVVAEEEAKTAETV